MSYANRLASEESAPAAGPRSWRCCAHGCPVTAGIEVGGGEVICRFHHGAAATDWQEITRRLRLRETLVRIAGYCAAGAVSGGWAERAQAAAEAMERPELAPNRSREIRPGVVRDETEFPLLYAQRINGVLARECSIAHKAPADFKPTPTPAHEPVSLADAMAGW